MTRFGKCLPMCRWSEMPSYGSDFHFPGCPNAPKDAGTCDCQHYLTSKGSVIHDPACPNAPGYVAPVSVPGSADQVWDKIEAGMQSHFTKPAPTPEPANAPPVHFGAGGCPPLCNVFSDGYRHEPPCVHAENPPRTIITASVTPASDADVEALKPQCPGKRVICFAAPLIARIESDAKVIAELRFKLQKAEEWERSSANMEKMLRARLAEVSEAAKTLLKYNNGVGRRCSDPHLKALEAILAKGDK